MPALKFCLITLWIVSNLVRSADVYRDFSSSAPSGPRIVITPSTSVVYLDSNGPGRVFACRTAGDKPEMFGQLKWNGPNSFDNYDELRQRHSITEQAPNSNSWDLELIKPTADDSGTYYCIGKYQTNDVHNASIVIKVVNPIRLENCLDRQFVVKGFTTGKITCRITGDTPRVTLWKDNRRIEDFGGRYKWDNDDGLVINGEVEQSDAGIYLLKITNDVTGERRLQTIDVKVHSIPQIMPYTGPPESSEFFGIESENAELRCNVTGSPRPLVHWLDPRLRNLTHVAGYHVNAESGVLMIDRVNRVDDNGNFQCLAFNNVGSVSKNVSMSVLIRPRVDNFDNKTVDEGSEVTFECRSAGFPKPQFSIRRHGVNQTAYRIGDGYTQDISTLPEGGGSDIYVHRTRIMANRSQHGPHYCRAENKAGSAERVGYLFVNHRPDLTSTPNQQFVRLGQRISLKCHIIAYPEPTVTWYSDNTQILNVDSKVETDGHTHIVTMSPANLQQTAFNRFVCRAENKMGYAEQSIIPRYITAPGTITASILDRSPTSVRIQLLVPNDGGNRIKFFKYRANGVTLDMHNPIYNYREDKHNETILEAHLNPTVPYIIRNLFPFYRYRLLISAVNDAGEGDVTEIAVETQRPTRPDPPVIIKPIAQQFASGLPSDYQNGYLLRWSPPDYDNGDPIMKYIIRYGKLESDSLDIPVDSTEQRIVEQMNERPMYAKIGPLETNQKYKIQLQARNKYGDSEPVHVIIQTLADRPEMVEFQPFTFSWFAEDIPTLTLIILLVAAIVLLISIDIIFCTCFQIGLSYLIKNCCCPFKANSVMSDKI